METTLIELSRFKRIKSTPPPLRVAWEITRRCDQVCEHCVNRSGKKIPGELTEAEATDVCTQLIQWGVREVAFTGGEPYLRADLAARIRQLRQGGLSVTLQTGGRMFDARRARRLADAGLGLVGVSVDGLEATHDQQRGWKGSFQSAARAISAARDSGMLVSVNTQINRLTLPELPTLVTWLEQQGVHFWQPSLTIAAGRADAHADWIIQPYEVVGILDLLAELKGGLLSRALEHQQARALEPGETPGASPQLSWKDCMQIEINSDLGYFGPHEALLRSRPGFLRHWTGPSAGLQTLFIEADGTVKGAPFLPSSPYAAGTVRDTPLPELWESKVLQETRRRDPALLWGFCRTCYYAPNCHGGDILITHMTMGKRGNDPFCYHRVSTLHAANVREHLVPWELASGDEKRLHRAAAEQAEGGWDDARPGRFVVRQEAIGIEV